MRIGIRLRGKACACLEHPVEMKRADAQCRRQAGKRRRLLGLANHLARPNHQAGIALRLRGLTRPAALAGTKSSGFRGIARCVESDILTARGARGTRRPAVDARGPNRKQELPVGAFILRHDGLPSSFIGHFASRHLISPGAARIQANTAPKTGNSASCGQILACKYTIRAWTNLRVKRCGSAIGGSARHPDKFPGTAKPYAWMSAPCGCSYASLSTRDT